MALPSGAKQLEYIKSSGTQYIDLDYFPTYNTRVVLDVKLNSYSATRAPFGCRNANSTSASAAFLVMQTGANTLRSDYFGSTATLTLSTTTDQRMTIDKNKNVLTVNGQSVSNTAVSSGSSPYSLMLFTYNNSGNAGSKTSMELYGGQVYEGTQKVFELIPCELASGEIGLWDDVNSAFYGNNGTGVFTGGAEVTPSDPGTSGGSGGGHGVLAGGAVHDIGGGTALIGGVSYDIESGTVLSGGVAMNIGFTKEMFTLTVSGYEATTYYGVKLNGEFIERGTNEIPSGTKIVCVAQDSGTLASAQILLNGEVVKKGTNVAYTHEITSDTTVNVSYGTYGEHVYGIVKITTS